MEQLVMRHAVRERMLVQRVRRALAKGGERLLENRGGHGPANVGQYYVVDGRNIMTDHDADLESLGRDLGVLRSWERLVDDDDPALFA